MTAGEFASKVISDERFLSAPYAKQMEVRASLINEIERNDRDFRAGSQEDRLNFKKSFMTQLPQSIVEARDRLNVTLPEQRDEFEMAAVDRAIKSQMSLTTGRSELTFADGVQDSAVTARGLMGRLGKKLLDVVTGIDHTDLRFNSPLMQDAVLYAQNVNAQSSTHGGAADYKFGKGLIRTLNGSSEIVMMAGLYGSVGSEGLFTSWIPKIAKAVGMGTKATTFLQWGLQAVTETAGYVGEELLLDVVDGNFADGNGWEQWAQGLAGDVKRGAFMFAAGELLGGVIGRGLRGMAKGVVGVSPEQAANHLKRLTNGELEVAMRDLVGFNDVKKFDAITDVVRGFGGEDAVKQMQKFKNRIRTFSELGKEVTDDTQAMKAFLTSEMDAVFKGNTLKRLGDLELNIKFKDGADLMGKIKPTLTKNLNLNLSQGAKVHANRTGKIAVSVEVKGTTKSVKMSARNVVDTVVPKSGVIDANRLKSFAGSFDPEIKVKGSDVFDPKHVEKGSLIYPKKIDPTDAKAMKAFANSLEPQLRANGVNFEGRKFPADAYLEDIRFGKQWDPVEIGKMEGISGLRQQKNGAWVAKISTGRQIKGTLDQLGEYAHFQTKTLKEVNNYISGKFGHEIQIDTNQKYLLLDDKKLVGTYDSLKDLWFDNRGIMPKKGMKLAPDFIAIDGSTIQFNTPDLARGKVKDVIDKLDKFETLWEKRVADGRAMTRVTKNGDSVTFLPTEKLYHVQLGHSGLTKIFDNLADMKKFLRKDLKKFDGLYSEVVDKFGGELRVMSQGGYQIFGDSWPNAHYFKDLDSVAKFVGEQDRALSKIKPFTGSDLEDIDIANARLSEFKSYKAKVSKMEGKATARLRSGLGVNQFISRFVHSTTRIVEMLNIPPLSKAYQDLLGRGKFFAGEYNSFKNLWRSRLKGYDRLEIHQMGQILLSEINPKGWREAARKLGIDTAGARWAEMDGVMQFTRTLMDDLGARAGISPEDWIQNYLPRMKNITIADLHGTTLDDPNLIRHLMDPNRTLKAIDPPYEHMRIADLYTARLQTDLESIVDVYSTIMMRKQYLGDSLMRFDKELLSASKAGLIKSETMVDRLRVFERVTSGQFADRKVMEQYMHRMDRNHLLAQKHVFKDPTKAVTDYTAKELKLAEKILNADISNGLSTFQTAALMTGKLWMPLRNSAQVHHLGAVYGNVQVLRSIDNVIKNADELYKRGTDLGIVQPRSLNDRRQFFSWLNETNRVGINWFRNSDDMTRLVGMQTVSDVFDESLEVFLKGKGNVKKFMRATSADMFDSGTQEQFVKLISQGDTKGAKVILQRNMVDWTMFNYTKGQKPAFAQHNIGRMMLSYATYPVQFSEMFGRLIKNDPLAAVRLSSNMFVLSALYNDVLGTKGYEGNPLKTLMFVGGPLFTGGMDAFRGVSQSFGNIIRADSDLQTKASKLAQAAGTSAWSVGRVTVPFNWYPKRALEGLRQIDQGEMYMGTLSMAGLNMNSEAIIPNVALGDIIEGFYDMQ